MDVVLRASAVFLMLFVVIRLMGKRQLGQMTPFEFVALIVLGDFVQGAVTHNDYSLTAATLAVVTFSFWGLVLGWASYFSPRARRMLEGEPRIVIRDGQIDERMLARDRITKDEVLTEMRLQGIAHLDQVAFAVLETNGRVSFIKSEAA